MLYLYLYLYLDLYLDLHLYLRLHLPFLVQIQIQIWTRSKRTVGSTSWRGGDGFREVEEWESEFKETETSIFNLGVSVYLSSALTLSRL